MFECEWVYKGSRRKRVRRDRRMGRQRSHLGDNKKNYKGRGAGKRVI